MLSHHLLGSQRWVRLSILVALGTTLGFATIDHWVIRSSNAIPDLVRFGLQVPAILICLLATTACARLRAPCVPRLRAASQTCLHAMAERS